MTRAPQGNIKFTHSTRRSQVKKNLQRSPFRIGTISANGNNLNSLGSYEEKYFLNIYCQST